MSWWRSLSRLLPMRRAELERQISLAPVDVVARPVIDHRGVPAAISLDGARAHWQVGDWKSLCEIEPDDIRHHPDKAKLALLAAAGHQQTGNLARTRELAQCAKSWGCEPALIAKVLIAGVHNTLGCASSALGNSEKASRHFQQSVGAVSGDKAVLINNRRFNELLRLGLLREAAERIDESISNISTVQHSARPDRNEIAILKSQIELLNHQLSLAQKRNQLYRQSPDQRADSAIDPARLRSQVRERSVSQLGQDLWVLERTAYKRNGYFVDFGATDGILLSNTYLLETEFAWTGICAEPNPRYFERLERNRSCVTVPACIGPKSGEILEFVLADEYGGFTKDMRADMHADKRAAYYADPSNRIRMKTISLHDLLVSVGAPKVIDYISVDTEGSELAILSTFPFEEWDVRMWTVEHNYTPARDQIRRLLTSHGYACVAAEWDDWYYKET